MAHHDYDIANADGGTFRADVNAVLAAIVSGNSGPTAPTPTFANMVWWDMTANLIKRRNGGNTAWVTIAAWDGTTYTAYSEGTAITIDQAGGVQSYDADTAKTDQSQAWTGVQRSAFVIDNDGNLNLGAAHNFKVTPTGNITLQFSGEADGTGGTIILDNSGGHQIILGGEVKARSGMATDLSSAGVYVLGYITDGTTVWVFDSEAVV